jgi:membrane protease YdiL (CAAX protease family)
VLLSLGYFTSGPTINDEKIIEVSISLVWFIFPILFLFKNDEFIAFWSEGWNAHWGGWILGIVAGLLGILVFSRNYVEPAMDHSSWLAPLSVISAIVSNAFGEEVIFRWWLINYLKKIGLPNIAIVGIQTALFALVHMQYYEDYLGMIFVIILGGVFGIVVLRQKNIAAVCIAHAITNLITVIATKW